MVLWPTGPSSAASASLELLGAARGCRLTPCTRLTHAHKSRTPRLCLLCFWTVKASVSLCSYVVNNKPSYNPDDSAVDVRPPPPGQLWDMWAWSTAPAPVADSRLLADAP